MGTQQRQRTLDEFKRKQKHIINTQIMKELRELIALCVT